MNWHISIDSIAAFVGAILVILGAWWKLAQKDGSQEKEIENMKKNIAVVLDKVDSHDKRLGDGAVSLGRIDEKLDALKESMVRVENAVQRHITKEIA